MAKNGRIGLALFQKEINHPAVVCTELIGQTEAFTAPRGRLEMGGLLIGHLDEEGNNVAVCGFFPQQTEESSGYCEFGGMYNAIAAAACNHANESVEGEEIPNIRIIGWIHTHPDIGIFLSGIDVSTFKMLRDQCAERRFMAVVVDPLRGEHGVFLTERKANKFDNAGGHITLEPELEARYHVLLDRLRSIQGERGLEFLPCIMPGHLRGKRNAMGDRDDVEIEMRKGHFKLARTVDEKLSASDKTNKGLREKINSQANQIQRLENQIRRLKTDLRTAGGEVEQLKTAVVELNESFVNLRTMMFKKLLQANDRINKLESFQRYPILIPVKQILE